MENSNAHYYKEMPDADFCVDIIKRQAHGPENSLGLHWHEHLQIYYVIEGRASLDCNNRHIDAEPGNLIVVNSNEVHSSMKCCSEDLQYYILRIDPSFLFSNQVDACQAKYILPLSQNLICFCNFIENDTQINNCVKEIIEEYNAKQVGYELEVKALVYHLLVLLLRGYISRVFTQEEFDANTRRIKSFEPVLKYIENNYTENITTHSLAACANLSLSHFCRTFKQVTGKTATDYINDFRLSKAISLINKSDKNITEIAIACGFCDANYFSRIFKKRFEISPTEFRKKYAESGRVYEKILHHDITAI